LNIESNHIKQVQDKLKDSFAFSELSKIFDQISPSVGFSTKLLLLVNYLIDDVSGNAAQLAMHLNFELKEKIERGEMKRNEND